MVSGVPPQAKIQFAFYRSKDRAINSLFCAGLAITKMGGGKELAEALRNFEICNMATGLERVLK